MYNISTTSDQEILIKIHYPSTNSEQDSGLDTSNAPYPTIILCPGHEGLHSRVDSFDQFSERIASHGINVIIVQIP